MSATPDRRWLSREDRERIVAFEAEVARYRRLAGEATNEQDRRHFEQLVGASERKLRTFRTYPFSIWLRGMLVCVALLPWALLTRAGNSTVGLVVSAVVVLMEVVLVAVQKRRRRRRGHGERT